MQTIDRLTRYDSLNLDWVVASLIFRRDDERLGPLKSVVIKLQFSEFSSYFSWPKMFIPTANLECTTFVTTTADVAAADNKNADGQISTRR